MNKLQLLELFILVSLVRGDLSVLQANALPITIVLSVLACGVPIVCFSIIICLIIKLIQMHFKLRVHNHHIFEECNYNLSLTEGTNRDYKRISNVYEVVDTESIVSQYKNSSDGDKNGSSNSVPCNEENTQTDSVQKDCDLQQALKLSFPVVDDDDSVYMVMTSPREYDQGPEEAIQTFD